MHGHYNREWLHGNIEQGIVVGERLSPDTEHENMVTRSKMEWTRVDMWVEGGNAEINQLTSTQASSGQLNPTHFC